MASNNFSADASAVVPVVSEEDGTSVIPPIENASLLPNTILIPVPRRSAMEAIDSVVKGLGGHALPVVSVQSDRIVGYRMAKFGLTVLGTGCRRPLLCEEAQDLRTSTGDHMLIVRMEEEAHGFGPFTLDLLMHGTEFWLTRYRLWQIHPTADLWLVPSQGEGRSIRIVDGYLAISPRAPFFNLFEREHGFTTAAELLNRLQEGF